MIDWAQTLTILGGVAAMWFGCFTILREDMKIMKEDMKENQAHWREMFMYMNGRIDNLKNKDEKDEK